jgi:NADH/NAD ratio-sensing transcriptional regulator Rex
VKKVLDKLEEVAKIPFYSCPDKYLANKDIKRDCTVYFSKAVQISSATIRQDVTHPDR